MILIQNFRHFLAISFIHLVILNFHQVQGTVLRTEDKEKYNTFLALKGLTVSRHGPIQSIT